MPPARSISSYFNKVPSTSPTAITKTAAVTNGSTAGSSTAQISPTKSSPSTGQKRGFLSDAARKAIEEGASEASSAKKAKPNESEFLICHIAYRIELTR